MKGEVLDPMRTKRKTGRPHDMVIAMADQIKGVIQRYIKKSKDRPAEGPGGQKAGNRHGARCIHPERREEKEETVTRQARAERRGVISQSRRCRTSTGGPTSPPAKTWSCFCQCIVTAAIRPSQVDHSTIQVGGTTYFAPRPLFGKT